MIDDAAGMIDDGAIACPILLLVSFLCFRFVPVVSAGFVFVFVSFGLGIPFVSVPFVRFGLFRFRFD
jgi:hypothetical protein